MSDIRNKTFLGSADVSQDASEAHTIKPMKSFAQEGRPEGEPELPHHPHDDPNIQRTKTEEDSD